MDEPEPRSAKDASHVKKTLEHADDLYDAGSYQECLTTLLDLLENYHMAVLPRMKVLIMLSTLVEDWQYAEDWRMNAEDIYLYCDRHRNEVFNDIVLRAFRTTLACYSREQQSPQTIGLRSAFMPTARDLAFIN
ncbi:hypothetical protein D6C93_08725 [Aureobasidium pullulans]|uniref:Uncharacterized protein n=1 Tax=Aureobasidium pullulans TaxID=5580 RepID=A0A4S9F3Q0_AURPU|nr:hypothetical protein D6D10_02479 [Aureobasidium pullulans]THY83890.1 hypothetical protein D6C93_08725 [Aureobasidium pullulans]